MEAARNLARRPSRPVLALADAPEPECPPEALSRLAIRDLAQALSRLDPGEVRLLMGAAVEGRSYADLAAGEGVPVGTVMSRIARARARLRMAGVGLADPVLKADAA
jgi:RNA polymerase sigma-70 factor (ECF subfamily)